MSSDPVCPCGAGAPEAACCGPIIAGAAAPTAVALMRSRYAAYVRGAIDHVVGTHDPRTRAQLDAEAAAKWSRETQWLGLEIIATDRGGEPTTKAPSSSSLVASRAAYRSRSASDPRSGGATAAGAMSTAR